MAGTTRTRKAPAARKTTRKRKKPAARKKTRTVNYPKIFMALGILILLAVSMGALGYVVFFRTVVI